MHYSVRTHVLVRGTVRAFRLCLGGESHWKVQRLLTYGVECCFAGLCGTAQHKPGGPSAYVAFLKAGAKMRARELLSKKIRDSLQQTLPPETALLEQLGPLLLAPLSFYQQCMFLEKKAHKERAPTGHSPFV